MERERRGAPVRYILLVKRAVRKARGNVSVRYQAKKPMTYCLHGEIVCVVSMEKLICNF